MVATAPSSSIPDSNCLLLLYSAIEHNLQYFDYENAILLAERALVLSSSSAFSTSTASSSAQSSAKNNYTFYSIFLLAKANYLCGNVQTAKSILEGNLMLDPSAIFNGPPHQPDHQNLRSSFASLDHQSAAQSCSSSSWPQALHNVYPACLVLYGRICLGLSTTTSLQEGITTLYSFLTATNPASPANQSTSANSLALSQIWAVLGLLSRKLGRTSECQTALDTAIQLNPLLVDSYRVLADIGCLPPSRVQEYCQVAKIEKTWHKVVAAAAAAAGDTGDGFGIDTAFVSSSSSAAALTKEKLGASANATTKSASGLGPGAPSKRRAVEGKSGSAAAKSISQRAPLTTTTVKSASAAAGSGGDAVVKKRSRENSSLGDKKTMATTSGPDASRNERTPQQRSHQPLLVDLVSLLQKILTAHAYLANYNGSAALGLLNLLPISHYETPHVLLMVAKAHFELHQYQQACTVFKQIRQLNPTQMEGMDIYGTCLWHLKKKVILCSLGKELEHLYPRAPQTWCVIGNYFSILHEHDSAINAFKRAVDVSGENHVYAFTLMGHEYLSNEDMESAARAFKSAVRLHNRHYNAIFGLGLIERKQEKYLLAEYYFRQALEMAPANCILLDCLASVVQKEESRYEEALAIYDKVLELLAVPVSYTAGGEHQQPHHQQQHHPQTAVAMTSAGQQHQQRIYSLHRAQLLFVMERYEEVVEILQHEVGGGRSGESAVYFLLGKALAKLGRVGDAIMAMTLAQDYVQHKSSSIIKEAIEKLLDNQDSGGEDDAIVHDTSFD